MHKCISCPRTATFGYKNAQPTACRAHKTSEMMDKKHPPCKQCHRRPSFANKHGQPPSHCKLHKSENMVNVKHPLCRVCHEVYASFGHIKNRPLTCYEHRSPYMTNVKATLCQTDGCQAMKPKYGNSRIGRAYCAQHYDPTVHWFITTCCATNCLEVATHSHNGAEPFVFCVKHAHAEPNFVAASLQTCLSCNMVRMCSSNNTCLSNCSQPKSTECLLKDFLIAKHMKFVYNRCVPGCKKRPDFLFPTDVGYIVVENDEHRHQGSLAEKEAERMKDIQTALVLPVHFIRFNPDVSRSQTDPLPLRHAVLYNKLQQILENVQLFFQQQPQLSVQYLFY